MAQLDLATTMDAIAAALVSGGVVTRAYGWPNAIVGKDQAVVGYPDPVDFDVTFGRGLEHAVIPVHVICGFIGEERTRDKVSALISGVADVKDALDGNLGGVVSSLRVMDARVETYDATPGGAQPTLYVAVRFQCDVLS
jgi:hypothetical protein